MPLISGNLVCEFVAHKTFHIWLLPKYNTNSVMSLTVDIT